MMAAKSKDANTCGVDLSTFNECRRMYRTEFGKEPKNVQEIRSGNRPRCLMTKDWGVQFFPRAKGPCRAWHKSLNKKLDNYGCYCKSIGILYKT